MTGSMLEIFGYIGSVFVVLSMLMSSIVKLRVINTVGCVISGVYAVLCGALPLALMNFCLIIINIYSLTKLLKSKKIYDLIVEEAEDTFVSYFLDRYSSDILHFFPQFEVSSLSGQTAYLVCCEGNPAGIMIGRNQDGVFDVRLDYTTPVYRDSSVGAFLYSHFSSNEIRELRITDRVSEDHISYMKKMGFEQADGIYRKFID